MGTMLVFTNAIEGRDDEYNKWYNEIHLKDIVATPSFKSGKRFKVSDIQGFPAPEHRYLSIYEFDGPPQAAMENLTAATPNFQMTDALAADFKVLLVEDL
jgi:hypothetical protein